MSMRMNSILKFWHLTVCLVLLCNLRISAQQERAIPTGVPFLLIPTDARAAGMGDVGVATSPDAYSARWNHAKSVFSEDRVLISFGYTPYLESIVNDVNLIGFNYTKKTSDRSAWGVGLTYFGLGEIQFRQTIDEIPQLVNPSELALDVNYALKLSERFGLSVGTRFITSNLRFTDNTQDTRAANALAVQIGGYYQSDIIYNNGGTDGRFRTGFSIMNLGSKIKYDGGGQENFLPSILRAGVGYDFIFNADSQLAVSFETQKLLVPTPRDFDNDGDIDSADNLEYQNIGFFEGFLNSFSDAPGGFSEELKEIAWSLGLEYSFQDTFALRTGYFNESKDKGSRSYATFGAGFDYRETHFDLSYLFSTSQIKNPLENTLRISITFAIDKGFYE